MRCEPIAVVGQGCVLPGANDPDEFWTGIVSGRVDITEVRPDEWRMPENWTTSDTVEWSGPEQPVAGVVRGFALDPSGFALPEHDIVEWDPALQWLLHAGRQALGDSARQRAGLVIGNLGYPWRTLAGQTERIWLGGEAAGRPRERYCSGLPAALAATALGLEQGGHAIDAACASSLYAIELACQRLRDRTSDLMLAGGVSGADGLLMAVGFGAMAAASPTGRSRPFQRNADGLVPAEGAALVALMRLDDAVREGRPIHGVIRAIGLSNDGRSGGFFAPAQQGQERAMRAAYQRAGLDPATVTLLECHATGTAVGDAVEARSVATIFEGHRGLAMGSSKANVGHLLTAAGAAGLIKILGAIRTGVCPATPGCTDPLRELSGPLRLLTENEPWQGVRRAAVNAFGFGGNNAHLIIEEFRADKRFVAVPPIPTPEPLAVVALGVRTGDGRNADDFRRSLFTGVAQSPASTVEADIDGLRSVPHDLAKAQPQQVLALESARDAAAATTLSENVMVLVGASCDPEGARLPARWRFDAAAASRGEAMRMDPAAAPRLDSAASLGFMTNILANRIGAQLGSTAPAFAVFDEEGSGLTALGLAARALRANDCDAAVVCAVDATTGETYQQPIDGPGACAITLVVKRLRDARADGDCVMAMVAEDDADSELVVGAGGETDPARLFGGAHAAHGLINAAAAVLALWHQVRLGDGVRAQPRPGLRRAAATVDTIGGSRRSMSFVAADRASGLLDEVPRILLFHGENRQEALGALRAGVTGGVGPARLAVVAGSVVEAVAMADRIEVWLAGTAVRPYGVAFRERPLSGEIAFCYTNGSGTYPAMARELLLGTPALFASLEAEHGELAHELAWAFRGDGQPANAMDQVGAASVLGLLHTAITRDVLGIVPDAVIGYSSGESAAMTATGVWSRLGDVLREGRSSELFDVDLGVPLRAIRPVWAAAGIIGNRWKNFVVNAQRATVETALQGEPGAHLLTVCTPDRCVVGGEESAVRRVIERLAPAPAMPIPYDIAAHAPEVTAVADRWYHLVDRPTEAVPRTRFYSCATAEQFTPTSAGVARALVAQGTGFIDFPALIERLYADGVRIFIEHGPSGLCTGWIRQILDGRDHVAVALDGESHLGLRATMAALAELAAAGLEIDDERLATLVAPTSLAPPPATRVVRVPRSRPPVQLVSTDHGELEAARPSAGPGSQYGGLTDRPHREVAASEQLAHAASTHIKYLGALARGHLDYLATGARIQTAVARRTRRPVRIRDDRAAGLPGPKFDRAQLEQLAAGSVSAVFGPLFAAQDDYLRQTRMPGPPLLLADRVLGIDATPGQLGTGTIWTETDVSTDSWYLDPAGRMPPGLLIEAGQADLLLISWLGADLANRGERVYRLLGGRVTFAGSLPGPGATLCYEIRIVDHAVHGEQWLFSFEYDCTVDGEVLLSVQGQAGFFSDSELASSRGVLWDPAKVRPPSGSVDQVVIATGTSFSAEQVAAFARGQLVEAFGSSWDLTRCHVRTPTISAAHLLLGEVTAFTPDGGPWKRGYLRAEMPVHKHDWYFEGHFLNDPCMPGSVMFDGCVQAMSFYLAAAGFTIGHDGARFEPVPGSSVELRCRGQVTPETKQLVYEVFVTSLSAGPVPTISADVLVSADGLKALHVGNLSVRLVADLPLDHWRLLGPPRVLESGEPADLADLGGLRGEPDKGIMGYSALLAGAWGRDEEYMGPHYLAHERQAARIPGPPFLFVSRILGTEGTYGALQPDAAVVSEYDIPSEAWYFEQNIRPTMPVSVLMEVALQPCGWLGNYVGSPLAGEDRLFIRNLDGDMTVHSEVDPGDTSIVTHARLTSVSELNDMIIETFSFECSVDGRPLCDGTTVFGFFTADALTEQVGMPTSDGQVLRGGRPLISAHRTGLPGSMLSMVDDIVEYDPVGGALGLGRVVASKTVNAGEWFFRSHFFEDPVMPGSLGVEAVYQVLQWFMLERGMAADIAEPYFELFSGGEHLAWKYRGQVLPSDREIVIELDLVEVGLDTAVANGWLWVDGRRIYHLPRLGLRLRPAAKTAELTSVRIRTNL